MRAVYIPAAAVFLAAAPATAQTPAERPSDAMVLVAAQKFVHQQFNRAPEDQYDLNFGVAEIYPQDDGTFAIVGGFMAAGAAKGNLGRKVHEPHGYGISIRATCAEHGKLKCWQLEKLVIDQKVILDK